MGLPGSEWIAQEAPGCCIKHENASAPDTLVRTTCLMRFGLCVYDPCCCFACLMNSISSGFRLDDRKLIPDFWLP